MSGSAWKVVVVDPAPDAGFEYEHEALSPLGVELKPVSVASDEELLAAAADADVVLPIFYELGARAIAGLERCRLIPSRGIGVDHIDVAAVRQPRSRI